MVYYLPASELGMLKSPLAYPLQQGSYRTASETNFSILRISYTAGSSLFCTSATDFMPTGGALNVVV
jgi:hypothetical protein